MPGKTTVSRGTLYNFASGMINIAGGYITAVVAARFLGPETFGMYSIVTSIVFLISAVLMTSVQQTTAKFVAENIRQRDAVKYQMFKIQAIISSLFFAAYYMLSPIIAQLLNDAQLVPYVRYCALIIVFQSLFSVYAGYLNGMRSFKGQAILISLYSLLKAALLILLVVLGYSIIGAITGFVAATLISLIASIIILKLKPKPDKLKNTDILKFAVPLFMFNIITVILMNIDLFFVKALSNPSTANILSGYYNSALQISRAPYYIISSLTLTIFPVISSLNHKGNKEEISRSLSKAIKYTSIVMLLLLATISTTSRQLIKLFYGEAYTPAGTILGILIFGGVIFSVFLLLMTVLSAGGEPKKAFYIGLLGLAIATTLNYLTVPKYSYMGAAVSTAFSILIAMLIGWHYTNRRFRIIIMAKPTAITIICAAAVALLSLSWDIGGIGLIAKYFILSLGYAVLLIIFKVVGEDDLTFFKRAIWK
jgi:stage V sporulation protein B